VIRLAIEQAQAIAAVRPDILGVGIGFKHRKREKYGARPRLAIKFLVRTKRKRPSRPSPGPINLYISVTYDGKNYRIPTDFERVFKLHQHQIPDCRPVYRSFADPPGSCGCVVVDAAGVLYLVTAGHVLSDPQSDLVTDGTRVRVAGVDVGAVVSVATYFITESGRIDVGFARLDGIAPPAAMASLPWSTMKSVQSEDQFTQLIQREVQQAVSMTGLRSNASGVVDSAYFTTREFDGIGLYSPILVHVRADNGTFCPGDSGAPVVSDSGDLISIHAIGAENCANFGWGVLASHAFVRVAARLGTTLKLYPAFYPVLIAIRPMTTLRNATGIVYAISTTKKFRSHAETLRRGGNSPRLRGSA
jgi:hypothetical protein